MLLVFFSCLGIAASAQEAVPTVVFSKEFPGSVPPYYSVTVQESGEAVYRTEPNDEAPIAFRLPAAVAGEIFSLARKLGPLQGATLWIDSLVTNNGRVQMRERLQTKTGRDGRYSLSGLYVGRVKVTVVLNNQPVMMKGEAIGDELFAASGVDTVANFDLSKAPPPAPNACCADWAWVTAKRSTGGVVCVNRCGRRRVDEEAIEILLQR